jgi:hypothetical protein
MEDSIIQQNKAPSLEVIKNRNKSHEHTIMSQESPTPRQRIDQLLIDAAGDTDRAKGTISRNDSIQLPTLTFFNKVFSVRGSWLDEIANIT